ncbi:glucans biosynthesis glucosyltransferase MdoH [Thiomonas sp.]
MNPSSADRAAESTPAMLPPEAALDMPIQRLDGPPPGSIEVKTQPQGLLVKRLLLIALTLVLALAASTQLRMVLAREQVNAIDIVLLVVFMPLFAWISFGFVNSAIGFYQLISGGHPGFTAVPRPAQTLRHRVAVLMPVYNEDVDATFGRVLTMARSIAAAGGAPWIDFFVLSDSDESNGRREQAAWLEVARESPIAVYYRRREHNTARKPGNIAEWVRRFGAAYECMLVLDADSLMSGDAIVGMASIMEARPSIGLLQTVPMITNARTLFQRWMQFASEAYGPIASAGLLWWSGSEASFWGHNAIVRTRAFAQSCGLPELPGKPPFGGHIQSHDIFESALLRRRGWAVHMVMIDGSYEEFPPSIVDYVKRDRRWMQGNMQHLRLLGTSGLHWVNRLHLLLGAAAYLMSPFWLVLLLASAAQVFFSSDAALQSLSTSWVLWLTLLLLFGPKLMGLIWMLASTARRRRFGGTTRILRSVALDIPLAVLMAPVTMVAQTKSLVEMVVGIPSGWAAQVRQARSIPVLSVLRRLREHLLLGLAFASLAWFDPQIGLWFSPIALGLLSSPWLISWTSSERLGTLTHAWGFFWVPPVQLGEDAPVADS